MGWKPAQQTAGVYWMPPYLAELLADPYSAVRAIAFGSLRKYPSFSDLKYDFVRATGSGGTQARNRVQTQWAEQSEDARSRGPGPLLTNDRGFDREAWEQLMEARDNRPIALIE
jgi:hypothetical protein